MKNLATKSTFLALAFIASSLFMSGCTDSGADNPITPEKMAEISKKQEAERENFRPDTTRPTNK
jgi:outer membrane lipoprotein-sorting protein